ARSPSSFDQEPGRAGRLPGEVYPKAPHNVENTAAHVIAAGCGGGFRQCPRESIDIVAPPKANRRRLAESGAATGPADGGEMGPAPLRQLSIGPRDRTGKRFALHPQLCFPILLIDCSRLAKILHGWTLPTPCATGAAHSYLPRRPAPQGQR